jgi:UDP-N-acetylmuramate dehydrogenase
MPNAQAELIIQRNIPLSDHTTIGLGGRARLFAHCSSVETLQAALAYARRRNLRVQILGGGSNTIFADRGFGGLVLKVGLHGVSFREEDRRAEVTAGAGEQWDDLVVQSIARGLAGIECLSGIPGCVGATPIQNVGAYGQEVGDSIVRVRGIDVRTLEIVEFSAKECGFRYRQSRFKARDAGRYLIVDVTFSLERNVPPVIRYRELARYLESLTPPVSLEAGTQGLSRVRSAVLQLRRGKSMVIDPADPDSRSVGSFFVNPVLTQEKFLRIERRWRKTGAGEPIVAYPSAGGLKIPAAWLVEHAGFKKGYRKKRAGISTHHALALVNHGGSTRELLALAREIERGVFKTFAIRLEREPVVVKF